mmetsp:Transcript_18982/g.45070  ORF Transcript_18982/g.45070 Transcript_18982/m.45070 type:complete len:259 (+) Transcript_18982:219-995(+)
MCDQWLEEISLAVGMATHARLGEHSALANVVGPTELLQMILDRVQAGTGVKSWRWVEGEDAHALVGFTTLQHTRFGTTIQLSHDSSTSIRLQESGRAGVVMVSDGETFPSSWRAEASVEDLSSGGGALVPEQGLRRGLWTVDFRGPDLLVQHANAPDMAVLLAGDACLLVPAAPAVAVFLGMPPPPAILVSEGAPMREIAREEACDTAGIALLENTAGPDEWIIDGLEGVQTQLFGSPPASAGIHGLYLQLPVPLVLP